MDVKPITIHFPSQRAKDLFLGGILDGWGENSVDLRWDSESFTADDATDFTVVSVAGMEWCEDE